MYDYFSLIFIMLLYLITFPPKECISSGLTLENVFSHFLVKEIENFTKYHLLRINLTVIFYATLPFTYIALFNFFNANYTDNIYTMYTLILSLTMFVMVLIYIIYLYSNNWNYHPFIKNLKCYNENDWSLVAESLDNEFNTFDKFSSSIGNSRFYLTNSWIIKVECFMVKIIQKNDGEVYLNKAFNHSLSHISDFGAQILEVVINPKFNTKLPKFTVRLTSFEYNQLKEALDKPIVIAENIIIKKSLADHFIDVFSEVIKLNPPYNVPPNIILENCLGCLVKPSEIKLYKRCRSNDGQQSAIPNDFNRATTNNLAGAGDYVSTTTENSDDTETEEATTNGEELTIQEDMLLGMQQQPRDDCKMCYCRPMWCISCMAKWFASRQDQKRPENWLSRTSPCPLCRSTFCILDVCLLAPPGLPSAS